MPGDRWIGLAMALAICVSATQSRAQDARENKRVRVDHPVVVVTVQLGSVGPFAEVPIFEVYFKSSEPDARTISVPKTGATTPGKPTPTENLSVWIVQPSTPDYARNIVIESCALDEGSAVDCRPVRQTPRLPRSGMLVELRLDQPVDWTHAALRLRMPAGVLTLKKTRDAEEDRPNPLVETLLPILGEKDLAYVQSRPYLRLDVSPIAKDTTPGQTGGAKEAASFNFSGGAYRSRLNDRWGVGWAGSIATSGEFAFNQVKSDFTYDRNLRAGDFLPFSGGLVTEADQKFDVIDVSASFSLRYLLPIHLNGSPFHDFVPNTGPKLRLLGAAGRRLRGAVNRDRTFQRVGYDVVWSIPASADVIIRVHHAGVWQWMEGQQGGMDFHPLWDMALETKIGQLTYFIGYQRGEAAPLFTAINTTRAGLVVRFK